MKHGMKIPVIIVTWNGYQDTVECMDSVLQSSGVEIAIYLVDNGSDHQEGKKLADLYKNDGRISVRQLPQNIGFARANNLILEELLMTDYRYVALLNNDTVVDPRWLEAMLLLAETKEISLVSAKLLNYYRREQIDNVGHQMLNTGEIIPIGHQAPADRFQKSILHMGPCAGAALYSVEMLREIGLFDTFFSTGYEDAELGLRATVAGYQSALAPDALVYHKMGQSVSKVFNQEYALMIQTAVWYTYLKLMPVGVIIVSSPFIVFKIVALSLVNIFFARTGYLAIQWKAIGRTFTKNWKIIRKERKHFLQTVDHLSSMDILARQRFFLFYDLKRFYRIFIQRKKSALDQYGGE